MNERTLNVFVAHGKDEEESQTNEVIARFCSRFANHGTTFKCVLGKEDWDKRFRSCGSWEKWAKSVSEAKVFGTNKRLYDIVLVTSDCSRLGKATADICRWALTNGLKVVALADEGTQFVRAVSVEENLGSRDADGKQDYKHGWMLRLNT